MVANSRHNHQNFFKRLPLFLIIFILFVSASRSVIADTNTPEDQENYQSSGNSSDVDLVSGYISSPDNFIAIENDRINTFSINSPQLGGRKKDIVVYFPSDYDTSSKNYPVLYLQNGEEIFVTDKSINNSWYLNEFLLESFTFHFDREVIIVGIESDPIFFWEEYGPWVNENLNLWMDPYEANRVDGGNGEAYLDFLIHSLKPQIDSHYRTLSDRENTSIGGYDMGGLISLFAGLTRSKVFSNVISVSPAIWFAEEGGTWLSSNRLVNLINTLGAPKNVVFSIDIAPDELVIKNKIRPVVNDSLGHKISFPQAYLEGSQAIVKALAKNGVPITNIIGNNQNPNKWLDVIDPSIRFIENEIANYFLPLFLTPKSPPEIISPASTSFFIGHNNEFIIKATGGPIPTITYTNALPEGVDFVDNGDGTAILSGTPSGPSGIYTIYLTAENGVTPPATQYFKLRVTDVPVCDDEIGCFYEFDISMNPYLNRTRTIHVYLPPHYDPDGEGYQVIYLTSAENLFGDEIGAYTSNDWDLDETLNELYDQTGKGTIAVGLEHDTHYPWDEYTIWTNNNMDNWVTNVSVTNGKATSYLNFIVNTLKPIIDSSYNTLPESEHTAFGGGSRNALLALCAGLTHPETFSKVMAFSPALWVAEGGGKRPLGEPVWFSTNQLGIWIDSHNVPSNLEFYLHTGTNEWQGSGGNYPYAYTSLIKIPENKLEWEDVYWRGAFKIKSKLNLDSVHFHETGGSHTPNHWKGFVDNALYVFGFYPITLD